MDQLTNGNSLAAAIRETASDLRELIDAAENFMHDREQQTVRDAASLLRVLANVAEGMPLARAMGSPGDWGYETGLGKGVLALNRPHGVAIPEGGQKK